MLIDMSMLPQGVGRSRHCDPSLTIYNCHALMFGLIDDAGHASSLVVWRHLPSNLRTSQRKRLRDLRPGDQVIAFGEFKTVTRVEIYR